MDDWATPLTATISTIVIGQWPRRMGRVLLGQRFLPLWVTAGLMWFVFLLCRGILVLCSLPVLEEAGAGMVFRAFRVGLLYDTVPLGYALAPMMLALTLAGPAAFARAGFRRLIAAYAAAVLVVEVVVESIGVGFFLHFGSRLNYVALSYLEHWQEVGTYIWNNYPAWLLVVGPVVVYYGLFRLFDRLFWRGQSPGGAVWPRPILAVFLTGLCVLACRGSLDHHPLRLGPAYFSDNEALSQLALNNFFTLFYASRCVFEGEDVALPNYPLPAPAESARVAAGLLLGPTDQPLPGAPNPLARRSRSPAAPNRYNVVLILMEGMSGRHVGALGHAPSQTPHFDALCREGLFFDRVFAVGERTCHGVAGVLCGHPDLGERSVLKRARSQGAFLTLPGLLRARGYRTVFIYGGNPDFDNMQGFLGANGMVQTFIGQDELVGRGHAGNWGVPDEIILTATHKTLQQMGQEPFFAFVLTVSNHEPYDVPPGRVEMLPHTGELNQRINAYRYADWALAEFFKQARQAPYFDNTIFVLVADHGRQPDLSAMIDVMGFRVPLLVYAPKLISPRVVSTVGSQTDVSPTILGLLGGSYEHCFLGRDLLTVDADDGFALLNASDRMAFIHGDRAVAISPRRNPRLFRISGLSTQAVQRGEFGRDQADKLTHEMLGYYGMAVEVYKNRVHNLPRPPAGQ